MHNTLNKVPLFHITRRKELPWYRAWLIRVIAVILGLVLCGIVSMLLVKINPLDVYKTMLSGAFGTSRRIWVTAQNMAILLGISLALAPAFKMRFWNLGGDGQTLMGVLGATAPMILLGGKVPNILLLLIMLVCAIIGGAIWALIPAAFKAKWNTNETLFTLMMNYVATQIVAFFIVVWENPKGASQIGIINASTMAGWLPRIGNNQYLLNILIIIVLTVVIYIYMKYTKHGYEISVVGESEPTARYVGIKVNRVILRTMLLSGAICGLVGFLLVSGTSHTMTTTIVDGRGFTGVMVAWLAKFNPFFMILTSLLLVFLSRGASEISTIYGLNDSFGSILAGILLFFIIGCEFFLNYQIALKKTRKEVKIDV
ncbi:MAG: ABC transporter permease [Lachnospiraceae bacterium]|nr:ABC transporter permease [Lachnospiraceae bacterium]